MKITNDIYYVGADDLSQPLFENIHPIEEGVSYNSYILLDEKNVLLDTADFSVSKQFLENIENVMQDKVIDYLIIHHMEPDHCACIGDIVAKYPNIKIITTKIASVYMKQFGFDVEDRLDIVGDGDTRNFGKHTLKFLTAPLVHWPEVMVSYDETSKILFSADAFGAFGSLDDKLFLDQFNDQNHLMDEYRRYYANIVGKYGAQVQALMKKLSSYEIDMICSLHGPVIRKDINILLEKYDIWSSYQEETKGALIIYSSMYGNTEKAVKIFEKMLIEKGAKCEIFDVSKTSLSHLVSKTFEYKNIILGAVTYNTGLFPLMHNYISDIKALNVQNKKIGIIENGTWAIVSGKKIKESVEDMKNTEIFNNIVTIKSSVNDENITKLEELCEEVFTSI